MKYDCALIQDLVSLYKDGALSEVSQNIVETHLQGCEACKAYYLSYSEESPFPLPEAEETASVSHFSKKIKSYRCFQAGLFLVFVASLLTMLLPWFGYQGVAEIRGAIVLQHPLAILGIASVTFAIWYPFQQNGKRIACGFTGFGLLTGMELLEFLAVPAGGTTGIQFGNWNYTFPYLDGIDLLKSFRMTLPGFYLGISSMAACILLFAVFTKYAKRIG